MSKKQITEEEMAQEKAKKIEAKKEELRKKYADELKNYEEELSLDPDDLEIKRIDERMAAMRAKKKKLKDNKNGGQRSNKETQETRKKIIMGAYIMGKPDAWNQHVRSPDFDKFVQRPIERELFGLSVQKPTPTAQTNPSANN